MTVVRLLPDRYLDSRGQITRATFNAVAAEAGQRGLRFVPVESRPRRFGYCDALWLDHSGAVSLMLTGRTLVLAART